MHKKQNKASAKKKVGKKIKLRDDLNVNVKV